MPVGYADGFRRDLTGTEVRVSGEPRRVIGIVSMDAFAVELEREEPVGAPVTILGHGVLAEDHARVAETINYELVCRINSDPRRARRTVVDALTSLDELFAGEEAWVVGGAVRDKALGRAVVDVDVACASPSRGSEAREAHRRRAVPALGAARRVAGRAGRRADGRLHAAAGADRGRPRHARLHDQRDRRARRQRGVASIRTTAAATWPRSRLRASQEASSRTTRCGCCARSASRTSSASGSSRRPRS